MFRCESCAKIDGFGSTIVEEDSSWLSLSTLQSLLSMAHGASPIRCPTQLEISYVNHSSPFLGRSLICRTAWYGSLLPWATAPSKLHGTSSTPASAPRCLWSKIAWHIAMQSRTAFLSWRLCHNRTPTSIWVKRISVSLASVCPFCLWDEESTLHLLFFCPFAAQV